MVSRFGRMGWALAGATLVAVLLYATGDWGHIMVDEIEQRARAIDRK